MGKYCEVCNKGVMSGNLVSHSNRKTKRGWAPNIQSVLTSDTGSGLFGLPVGAKPRLTVPGSLPPATGTAATRPAPAAPKGVTP